MEKERCGTGILGFDKLCQGGLIKDSINLILGNAGAGKTTFLLQFLYNGATKYNENGLFISFEQDSEEIMKTGRKLGMNFEKMKDKIEIMKYDPDLPIKEMQKKMMKTFIEKNIKRVCLDPINVFALEISKDQSIRRLIYDFLKVLKKLDICVLISGESDEEHDGTTRSVMEEISFCKYLSDSVIELFSSGISGSGDRAIRILKMRETNHVRGPLGMQLTDTGVVVLKS